MASSSLKTNLILVTRIASNHKHPIFDQKSKSDIHLDAILPLCGRAAQVIVLEQSVYRRRK
jgi:hypothetical protein